MAKNSSPRKKSPKKKKKDKDQSEQEEGEEAKNSSPRKKTPRKKHKGAADADGGEEAPTGKGDGGDAASPNALLRDLFQSRNERQKMAAGASSQDVVAPSPSKKASSSNPKKGPATTMSAAEALKALEADLQYVIPQSPLQYA
jgi:hypothetical protein